MMEIFIFLIVVCVGAVVFLVVRSGRGVAVGRFVPGSPRYSGSTEFPQSSNFLGASGLSYLRHDNGNLKSGHFQNVNRGNGAGTVVRPSGDYTGLFRGKEGTPQSVGRQVYGLPADKTGAPPAGMTQAAYARRLAGANPKVAAEVIKQWIRSS